MRIAAFLLAAGIAHGAVSDLAVVYDRIPSGETEGKIGTTKLGGSVLGASITFTAAGAWSVNKSTCNTNFKFNPTSGGAGAQTVRVMADDISSQSISAGQNRVSGTCSGDVDGTAFTIRWVVSRNVVPFVTDFNGNVDPISGCSKQSAIHQYSHYCPPTTDYGPEDGTPLPAVGDVVSDPMFGGVGRRLYDLTRQPYTAYAYNRTDDKIIMPNGIMDADTGTVLASLPSTSVCSGYSTMYWDWRVGFDDYGWCFVSSTPFTVKRWHLTGGAVIDEGTVYTHGYNLADHGSTGLPINAAGWISFPDSNNKFCMLNLPIGVSSLVCDDIDYTVRSVSVSPYPDSDGCLYSHYVSSLLGSPNDEDMRYFKLCGGVLTKLPRAPSIDRGWVSFGDNWATSSGYNCAYADSTCQRAGHQSAWYWNGASGRWSAGGDGGYNSVGFLYGGYASTFRNQTDSTYPMELGGGGRGQMLGHYETYGVCAAGAPVCVSTEAAEESRVRALTCTEAAGTCTCTVSGANNLPAASRALMHKFSVSGWNGYKTIDTSAGSTVTFSCTGAGTAQGGYSIPATVASDASAARSGMMACRGDIYHCRFIAKYLGRTSAAGDPYLTTVLPHISFRGSRFVANNGYGYPTETGGTQYETGFYCSERIRPNDFCDPLGGGGLRVIPLSDTTARAIVTTPYAGGTCTLAWGTTLDYSGATTQALSAGTTVREYTITGLTASTRYYLNVKCGGIFEGAVKAEGWLYAIDEMTTLAAAPGGSVAYSFLLPEAPTGTVTYRVEYGTTSGLGTQFDDGCSAGEKCHTTISLARGVVYYRYKWLNGSSAVIRETPIVSRVLR